MSTASEPALIVRLSASPGLTAVLTLVHAASAAVVLALPLGAGLQVLVLGLIGASLYLALTAHGVRVGPRAVRVLALNGEDGCEIGFAGARGWRAGRLAAVFVHPHLVILAVRTGRRRVSVVVPGDAAATEAFRALRVRLGAYGPTRLGGVDPLT